MSATLVAEPAASPGSRLAIPARAMLARAKTSRSPAETLAEWRARLSLLAHMSELDIHVYPSTVVEAHKQRMKEALEHRFKRIMKLCGVLTLITAIGCTAITVMNVDPELLPAFWYIPVALLICTGVYWQRAGTVSWQSCPLEEYEGKYKVPQAVRAIIQAIEAHTPQARFKVDYLKSDPVLHVGLEIDGALGMCCPAIWEKPGRDQPLLGQS